MKPGIDVLNPAGVPTYSVLVRNKSPCALGVVAGPSLEKKLKVMSSHGPPDGVVNS
jgi:hypothetical protein